MINKFCELTVVVVPFTVKSPVMATAPPTVKSFVTVASFVTVTSLPTLRSFVIVVSLPTVKSFATVTSFGKPTVTALVSVPDPVIVISFAVPVIVAT